MDEVSPLVRLVSDLADGSSRPESIDETLVNSSIILRHNSVFPSSVRGAAGFGGRASNLRRIACGKCALQFAIQLKVEFSLSRCAKVSLAVIMRSPSSFIHVALHNRPLLHHGLDTCSISQSIQTKAMPRPTTTNRSSNVRAGAVSMGTSIKQPLIGDCPFQSPARRSFSRSRERIGQRSGTASDTFI